MLDRKMTQVLVLVAAVAVAGCTALPGGGEQNGDEPDFRITQNDGLSISFQSLSNEYLEDDQIVLELSLQNTGEKEATGIRTELFGASFLIGTSADRTPSTSLQGVDRAAEQEGQSTSAIWRVRNPVDLDEGDSRSYPAGVRVLYDYGTTASASFRVVPRSGFEGGSSDVTTENSAGPLKAEFDIESPRPVSSPSGDAVEVSIPVTVRNAGDGEVASNLDGDTGQVDMNVTFPNAGDLANITDCGGSTGTHTFQLFEGSRDIICTASISTDVFETQLTLDAEMEYPYFETQETTFRLEGLAGDQTQ